MAGVAHSGRGKMQLLVVRAVAVGAADGLPTERAATAYSLVGSPAPHWRRLMA
jgi:hypothetical protein